MTALAGLRALGRIERRALSAHPWRTALVVLLVAVPTAALVGGSTLWTSARSPAATADGFEGLVVLVIGGFGFGEAALVIAAAFAVGLRRRQREIGLAGANGATPGALQLAVLGAALAQALVGTLVGLGVGLGAARVLHPWLARWSASPEGPLALSTPHVLAALALGPCAALAAAALPARAAARLPIRVALGGRRPATTRARGWLLAGLGLAGGGAALLAWANVRGDALAATGILVGSVLALAGFGALSPWLLDALARRAGPLPLAWRLSVRDAGRFRARNGPVVTAVLAGLALCVLLAAVQAAVEARVSADPLAIVPERVYLHAALALALVTGLVVVGVATALSAVESTGEARTLHTLGAPPGLLRRHLAARAAYLAALGGVLAVPAGLLPALGLLSFADAPLPFVAPWSTLAIAVLVLPALAWTGTWLCAAARGEPARTG